jgi:propanol-preferring alcohol dehydrogenase
MGFGASAHLMLQIVRFLQPNTRVFVFAREPRQREFALELGAVWSGDIGDRSPEQLHAIVDTTPAWKPIVESLNNLRPGGRLVINAIRKEDLDRDYLQTLSYHDHLWMEKEIKSVANITRFDLEEFLPVAAQIPIQPTITRFSLEQANEALMAVRRGGTRGAVVLQIHGTTNAGTRKK